MTTEDPIVAQVIADMTERSKQGIKHYGKTLAREDLTYSEWLKHAYEEALDLALYLKRAHADARSLGL
jgi:hypothetical protein